MSFHGGLLGVITAVVLFARNQKIDIIRLGDITAPCVPFGLFFGRIANFVNGELWGRPTDAPWGVVFCNTKLQMANGGLCPAGYSPRHPSQLYEALLEGLVLFAILRFATPRPKALAEAWRGLRNVPALLRPVPRGSGGRARARPRHARLSRWA